MTASSAMRSRPCAFPHPMHGAAGFRWEWVSCMLAGEDGVLYSAPSLVIHYILGHRYLPAAPFCAAVLATVKRHGAA